MFSDHLRKIDDTRRNIFLSLTAGLLMVSLLVGMAAVAGEQVQKAQVRGDSQASRQIAIASCVETSRGVALNNCFRIGSSEPEAQHATDYVNGSVRYGSGSVSVAGELATMTAPAAMAGSMTGIKSVVFAIR